MRLDDYFIALTVALLTCDEAHLQLALTALDKGPYEFHSPGVRQKVSVGVVTRDQKKIGLFDWVNALRKNRPLAVRVINSRAFEQPGTADLLNMPAPIAAGFAGTTGNLLQIITGKEAALYQLQTLFSASTWMSAAQFIEWIAVQPEQAAIWDRLLGDANVSNAMNDCPSKSLGSVRTFMMSEKGQALFDFDHDQLVYVVQETLHASGKMPIVPPDYAKFFTTWDPDDFVSDESDAKDEIPYEKLLTWTKPIDPREFVAWVDGLKCKDGVLAHFATFLNETDITMEAHYDAASARTYLLALDPDTFYNKSAVRALVQELQWFCQKNGETLTIPESLKDALRAPDDPPKDPEEAKEFVPERERLHLTANPDPFTLYLYEPVEGMNPSWRQKPLPSARKEYLSALREIEAFARVIGSPFAEAFQLARWVLETNATQFAALKQEECPAVVAKLGKEGFSEMAQSVLEKEIQLALFEFQRFAWPEARLRAVLSCSIADVFGGMGSWNDVVFTGDEKKNYDDVTQKLYSGLRDFFLSDVLNA